MSYYTIEQWTVKDVAKAFKEASGDGSGRRVSIPIFQRGLRWSSDRRAGFIDSLSKGYPFGALLFANNGNKVYSVIDGLQRGSTVCDYVFRPLTKENFKGIADYVLTDIRDALIPGNQNYTMNETIHDLIEEYVDEKKTFSEVDVSDIADHIISNIPTTEDKYDCSKKIKNALKPCFKEMEDKYNDICGATVPIIVYTGPNELMSDIFNRINKEGIPLNDYEIYAAVWDQTRIKVNKPDVVKAVVDKYLVLTKGGYNLENFDANKMLTDSELTPFEYLFGLGKYWYDEYECLRVANKKKDDDVNEISFEIIDACISDKRNIADLDKSIKNLNVNLLQRRIEESIEYVDQELAIVGKFKGNQRTLTALHSKYQIVSLVSYTFRKMYDVKNLGRKRSEWDSTKKKYGEHLLAHYVADIISNEWHDGGGSKVYQYNKERRYDEEITKERWESLLESYYQEQLANKQTSRFSNPTNSDAVILNCIYANIFTAGDQLSTKKYDIEHLATKEKMRLQIKNIGGVPLPVSCIANLCYLPENINRGKKEKILYEAKNLSMTIADIEEKFSFTKQSDFNWIFDTYDAQSANKLVKAYGTYLDNRFNTIKTKFLAFFGY